jgi:hypothetical protein
MKPLVYKEARDERFSSPIGFIGDYACWNKMNPTAACPRALK